MLLTFHDIHDATDISLFDDETSSRIFDRVHAVYDLADLRHFQILHKVIVQDCALY